MIKEIIDRILIWQDPSRNSGSKAKNRLQLVIAHDRARINPQLVEKMRQEILEVVSRYLEIDKEEMELSIEKNERMTSLTANLPIKRVKRNEK